jgi:hypothetical protein
LSILIYTYLYLIPIPNLTPHILSEACLEWCSFICVVFGCGVDFRLLLYYYIIYYTYYILFYYIIILLYITHILYYYIIYYTLLLF